jgi:hypothetical protein
LYARFFIGISPVDIMVMQSKMGGIASGFFIFEQRQ